MVGEKLGRYFRIQVVELVFMASKKSVILSVTFFIIFQCFKIILTLIGVPK